MSQDQVCSDLCSDTQFNQKRKTWTKQTELFCIREDDLELSREPRMIMNFLSSFVWLPRAEITHVCNQAWFIQS